MSEAKLGKSWRSCASGILTRVKVAIVVPYSWSFWGGVVDHADQQLRALRELGVDAKLVIGNGPPGSFTHMLHPGRGRLGEPPPEVLPVGRSVIAPANGSLPNIVLSPPCVGRIRRIFERERFDVIHVHEPLTPAIGVAALALWDGPTAATFHASGKLGWMRFATPVWGFLADRIDRRIAVSEQARDSASTSSPGSAAACSQRRRISRKLARCQLSTASRAISASAKSPVVSGAVRCW